MEIGLINLYKNTPEHFFTLEQYLNKTNDSLVLLDDYELGVENDVQQIVRAIKQSISDKYGIKAFVKVCDLLYKLVIETETKAFIVPIDNWQLLWAIKKSYLQLTDKHVIFVLPNLQGINITSFIEQVKYIDRFRNIHIGLLEDSGNLANIPQMYNLHFLQKEKLEEILKLHINNKRKYIGWRHHLNELRQKIKFHKDLIKHSIVRRYFNPYKEVLNAQERIPKVIHYCWFGGKPMPEDVKRYVDTWKLAAPEYELKCWNEDNFPFEKYSFAQEALKNKKWAFIADVARLHALYYEGGIYLDTDIELLKDFDDFLTEDGFTSYESLNLIAMAAIGFKKYHPWVAEMLLWYSCVHCDDDYTEIANTKVVSKISRMHYGVKLDGTDKILPCGLHIYPRDFFSPQLDKDKWLTTENTHCIHHFTGMW